MLVQGCTDIRGQDDWPLLRRNIELYSLEQLFETICADLCSSRIPLNAELERIPTLSNTVHKHNDGHHVALCYRDVSSSCL